MKTTSKMKTTSQIVPSPKLFFAPPPPPQLKRILPDIFFMTSHLESHGTTDIKPETLSAVQTRNGIQHVEYDIHGIAHVHAYRKDDI